VETHYQTLAGAAIEVCPAIFERAQIVAEMEDDNGSIRYDCQLSDRAIEGLTSDTARDYSVYKAIKSIRTQMTIPGQKPWSKCKFTLFPDGTFKFDVEYDD
jgi:hypothetical protein